MRIVCISDTHRNHNDVEVPDGDMLIFAGDGDWRSTASLTPFLDWFADQPHPYKIMIAGNHDFIMQDASPSKKEGYMKACFTREILYLENSGAEVAGYNVWGSPISPTFFNWAFMANRGDEITKVWDKIPEGIDILVTHGPPMGTLDMTTRGEAVGCYDLADAVKRLKPKLHVFGHIHGCYGVQEKEDTIFVNASTCNEMYQPVNKPIVIDL